MNQKPYVKSGRRKRIGITVLAILSLVLIAYTLYVQTPADTDIFGHLTYGKLILETGSVPTYDPYAYTTGQRIWINHEWLSEVIFGTVHELGGFTGLHHLRTGFILAYLFLFHELYRRTCPDPNLVLYCFLAGLMLLMMYPYMMVRPQLFSFLLVHISLLLFLKADRYSPRLLLVLPVVFVVWTNVHGGFIAGLGLVGVYGLCTFFRSGVLFRYALLGMVGSVVATLLNPYGLRLHQQIYGTLENPWTDRVIEDWLPLHATPLSDHPSLVVVMAVFLVHVVLFVRAKKNWTRNTLFTLSAVTFVAGVLHVRNVAFYALVGIPSLASLFDVEREEPLPFGKGAWMAGTLVLIGISLGLLGSYNRNPDNRFPKTAVEYLRTHETEGNLATPFNWGQYAIYHLHSKFRVSLDGRYDTVYPIETFIDFQLKAYRGIEWEEVLHGHDTDYVLVPEDSRLKAKLEASGYPALFRGPKATVYVLSEDSNKPNERQRRPSEK